MNMTLYFSARDTTYNEEPVILQHDQILLVIRYSQTFTSSISRIQGEMISLNNQEDFDYFDKIHITSHSGILPEYDINASKELNFYSLGQNPLQDAILEDGVNKFNNAEFCRILKYFEHEEYRVMPSLKLGGQTWLQNTVGPFLLGNEIQISDRNNENLRIIMHEISCKEDKVSGILRMYPATITPQVASRRTGLSTLTLSVEGRWNSSTGLLQMTGCLGPMLVTCDSGVILYVPKSFSSKQRSVVSGSIFSLKNTFHPIFFGLEMLSPGLHGGSWYCNAYLSYNYSKKELALEFKERIQEPNLITYIRKSIFRYPSLEEEKDGISTISNRLSDDLKINTFSSLETYVRVEVLSLGPSFRTNDGLFYQDSNHDVLNISLNLLLIEKPQKIYEESYRHVSKLYLEGVYDQRVGKVYLIGCRKVDFDHKHLERGLDCLIEVTIEYSPVNTRWFINPTAKITIVSQRIEDDSYQFKTIRLHTFMIHDRNHEKNVIFRKTFEGYFRIFLLLLYIAHMFNQTKKMKESHKPVPYISLLMLSVWIVGSGITITYSKDILIKSSESQPYKNQPYDLQNYKHLLNNLDYFARFLVLVTMFLMARIFRIVLEARKALHEQGEQTPSEEKVILVSVGAYVCYFLLRIIEVGFKVYKAKIPFYVFMKIIMEMLWHTVYDLRVYSLITQMVALRVWKPRLSDRLIKHFLIGLWIPYFIQSVYEFVRSPVAYPV